MASAAARVLASATAFLTRLSLNREPQRQEREECRQDQPGRRAQAPADELAAASQLLLPRKGNASQGVVAEAHGALFRTVVTPADGRPQEPAGVGVAEQVSEGETFQFLVVLGQLALGNHGRGECAIDLAERQVGHQPLERLAGPEPLGEHRLGRPQ